MSVSERFRTWLGSDDFAVTSAAIVVALVAGAVLFELRPESNDGYFALLLAAIAVPGMAREQWGRPFGSQVTAALWGTVASVLVVVGYFGFASVMRTITGDSVASILAFAATWILGLFAARAFSQALA